MSVSAVSVCLAFLCLSVFAGQNAAAKPGPDLAEHFATLAQQRPWRCKDAAPLSVPGGWREETALCAWQDRLRMRTWVGPSTIGDDRCVSSAAHWWTWARAGAALPVPLWQQHWTSRSLSAGQEKRVVLIRQIAGEQWRVSEWRWQPSPRAATRRWQEARWALLTTRAAQFNQNKATPPASGEASMLLPVMLAQLGARVGEAANEQLRYRTDGLCLQLQAAAPGAQQLRLSYAPDDSRLEQRAAVQLQLARRFPKASWLVPFNLLPAPAQGRGGAKFYAVWKEEGAMFGQLWIPTKGEGPLLRVHVSTQLAGSGEAQVQSARRVIERELAGLALQWTRHHE